MRRVVLDVDEEQVSEAMIEVDSHACTHTDTLCLQIPEVRCVVLFQNLVKHLPEQEQLNALAQFQDQYSSLSEPEQFGVVVSHTHTHTHTHTGTHTGTHRDTYTHRNTHTQEHTQEHRNTGTHTHANKSYVCNSVERGN